MRRILVTGAEGFVGFHLMPQLQAAFTDAEIIGTGLGPASRHRLDVTDPAAVASLLADLQPDACLHLAGIAAVTAARSDPAQSWAVNFHGALNVAAGILKSAPACRMIFISSAEAYGASFKSGQRLNESALLAPLNLYAATKAAAEMGLSAMTSNGLRLLRLRPFNHTGPGQSEAFVVPAFAGQIARIEAGLMPPKMAVGALNPERDFLDVRDVCNAYVRALQRFDDLPANGIINICSGVPVRIGTILESLQAQVDRTIEVTTDPARLRGVEITRALGDASLAESLLGWHPHIALEETLAAVLADARQKLREGRQPR